VDGKVDSKKSPSRSFEFSRTTGRQKKKKNEKNAFCCPPGSLDEFKALRKNAVFVLSTLLRLEYQGFQDRVDRMDSKWTAKFKKCRPLRGRLRNFW